MLRHFTTGDVVVLTADDAVAIAELPNVAHIVPEDTGRVVLRTGGVDYTTTSATASTEVYAAARNWRLARGTFFSADDVKSYAPAAVMGVPPQSVHAARFNATVALFALGGDWDAAAQVAARSEQS